jgi:hypothetical protein
MIPLAPVVAQIFGAAATAARWLIGSTVLTLAPWSVNAAARIRVASAISWFFSVPGWANGTTASVCPRRTCAAGAAGATMNDAAANAHAARTG